MMLSIKFIVIVFLLMTSVYFSNASPIYELDRNGIPHFKERIYVDSKTNSMLLDPGKGISINGVPIGGSGGTIDPIAGIDLIDPTGTKEIKMNVNDELKFVALPSGNVNSFGIGGVNLNSTSNISIGTMILNANGIDALNNGIPAKLDDLETGLIAVETSVTALDGRVTALESGSGATLEPRVASLEAGLVVVSNDVDTLEGTVTTQDTRLTTAEGNIGTLDGRVVALESATGTTLPAYIKPTEIDMVSGLAKSNINPGVIRLDDATGVSNTLSTDGVKTINDIKTGITSAQKNLANANLSGVLAFDSADNTFTVPTIARVGVIGAANELYSVIGRDGIETHGTTATREKAAVTGVEMRIGYSTGASNANDPVRDFSRVTKTVLEFKDSTGTYSLNKDGIKAANKFISPANTAAPTANHKMVIVDPTNPIDFKYTYADIPTGGATLPDYVKPTSIDMTGGPTSRSVLAPGTLALTDGSGTYTLNGVDVKTTNSLTTGLTDFQSDQSNVVTSNILSYDDAAGGSFQRPSVARVGTAATYATIGTTGFTTNSVAAKEQVKLVPSGIHVGYYSTNSSTEDTTKDFSSLSRTNLSFKDSTETAVLNKDDIKVTNQLKAPPSSAISAGHKMMIVDPSNPADIKYSYTDVPTASTSYIAPDGQSSVSIDAVDGQLSRFAIRNIGGSGPRYAFYYNDKIVFHPPGPTNSNNVIFDTNAALAAIRLYAAADAVPSATTKPIGFNTLTKVYETLPFQGRVYQRSVVEADFPVVTIAGATAIIIVPNKCKQYVIETGDIIALRSTTLKYETWYAVNLSTAAESVVRVELGSRAPNNGVAMVVSSTTGGVVTTSGTSTIPAHSTLFKFVGVGKTNVDIYTGTIIFEKVIQNVTTGIAITPTDL